MIRDDILRLLATPTVGEDAPTLPRIEDTLTAGYARALELEAEHRRLHRRLADEAAELATDDREHRVAELKSLARKLKSTDRELAELRELLDSLSARAAVVRAA